MASVRDLKAQKKLGVQGWSVRFTLGALSLPLMFLVISPLGYLLLWAFLGTATIGVLGDPTIKWFVEVLADRDWRDSVMISAALATVSSTLATLCIAFLGCILRLTEQRLNLLAASTLLLPLLFPTIVYGLALQYILGVSGLNAIVGLVIAHVCLVLPIHYLIILTAHDKIPRAQLAAAATLGAPPSAVVRFVYLPVMYEPLLTAWFLGFVVSFDELVVAMFVWGNATPPVAVKLWALFGRASEPVPAVVAMLMIVIATTSALAIFVFFKLKQRASRVI